MGVYDNISVFNAFSYASDDEFNVPSVPYEIEDAIENLYKAFEKSVMENVANEMEAIKRENAELKSFRDEKDKYDAEMQKLKEELEHTKVTANFNAKMERLDEITKNIQVTAWCVTHEICYSTDKCNKCDENRIVHFKSPSGKNLTEPCTCNKHYIHYIPSECELFRFELQNNGLKSAIYTKKAYGEYNVFHDKASYILYNGQPFNELNKNCEYNYYFLNEDDCIAYCNFLNNRPEYNRSI